MGIIMVRDNSLVDTPKITAKALDAPNDLDTEKEDRISFGSETSEFGNGSLQVGNYYCQPTRVMTFEEMAGG
jgi:hypothetical protein